VSWCDRPATGYGAFCTTHKGRDRKHGHPEQMTITAAMLKPSRKLIRAWIDRRPEDDVWPILEAAWRRVRETAEAELRAWERGQPVIHWNRLAYEAIRNVAETAEARVVIETVLAMAFLLEDQPTVFKSDRAFRVQLAWRFRALTDLHCGAWWNPNTGRVHRAYREFPPRAAEFLGRFLMETIGKAGVAIWREMERERAERERMDRQLMEAVA
jgi:hypothetical protein